MCSTLLITRFGPYLLPTCWNNSDLPVYSGSELTLLAYLISSLYLGWVHTCCHFFVGQLEQNSAWANRLIAAPKFMVGGFNFAYFFLLGILFCVFASLDFHLFWGIFFSSFFHIFILQIEPIPSGNLPPGFDSSACRSVWVSLGLLFPFVFILCLCFCPQMSCGVHVVISSSLGKVSVAFWWAHLVVLLYTFSHIVLWHFRDFSFSSP